MSCRKIRFVTFLSIMAGIFFPCYSAMEGDESPQKRFRAACPPPVFETPPRGVQPLSEELKKAIEIGLRTKLLANVYLGDEESRANIFVPVLTFHFNAPDGLLQEETHFVRSDKGKICLFASGGSALAHIWEKGIHQIYPLLFGKNPEKCIKVIRAGWLEKHLYKDRGLSNILGKSPEELHSEIFWKTYVTYFLKTQLSVLKKGRSLSHIEVQAFSWWDVCDHCHKELPYEHEGVPISYKVVSSRAYEKHYTKTPEFEFSFLKGIDRQRKKVLKDIFDRIMGLAELYDDQSTKEKRAFWTTHPGVEAAKWLGHTFHKENPLLKDSLESVPEIVIGPLKDLLSYLRKENWEFSCYQKKSAYSIQKSWKRHWGQRVIPHFGWIFMGESRLEDPHGTCEMCGKEGISDLSLVYHPKHRGTSPKTAATREEQEGDSEDGDFEAFLKGPSPETIARRKRSLTVGSECVKYMRFSKAQVREQRRKQKKNSTKMDPLRDELRD